MGYVGSEVVRNREVVNGMVRKRLLQPMIQ